MEILTGKSSRHKLSEETYLDISVFPKRWVTLVNMSVWEKDKSTAIAFSNKRHVNFDKFLPIKTAEKIAVYLINNQSQKVAGIKLV